MLLVFSASADLPYVGMAYGVPPLLKFGNKTIQEKFLPDLLTGRTRCCIAITEPSAGSDVANVATTAVKSDCGKFYIVNGQKKWISNGLWANYATMVVRTGGAGASGLSLLFVPLLNTEGVNMRPIHTMGEIFGGTTFIDMEDVKVPVENLIGEENQGMKYIMVSLFDMHLLCLSRLVTDPIL